MLSELFDKLRFLLATPFLVVGMLFGWIGCAIGGMDFMADIVEIDKDD